MKDNIKLTDLHTIQKKEANLESLNDSLTVALKQAIEIVETDSTTKK